MQIHSNIDPAFWNDITSRLTLWPDTPHARSQAAITRYALSELAAEIPQEEEGLIPTSPIPDGTLHIQAKTNDPHEINDWQMLATRYGNLATAAKFALAFLRQNLIQYETQDPQK